MSETTENPPAASQEENSEPALSWKGKPPTAEENERRIMRVMNALPSNIPDEDRMFIWRVEKAREAFFAHKTQSCKSQCLDLLNDASIPNYAQLATLLLLSTVVPLHESFQRLDQALDMCNEISKTYGPGKYVDGYLGRITRLRAKYEELQNEKGKPEVREDEGRAGPDCGTGTADDSTEELLSQMTLVFSRVL